MTMPQTTWALQQKLATSRKLMHVCISLLTFFVVSSLVLGGIVIYQITDVIPGAKADPAAVSQAVTPPVVTLQAEAAALQPPAPIMQPATLRVVTMNDPTAYSKGAWAGYHDGFNDGVSLGTITGYEIHRQGLSKPTVPLEDAIAFKRKTDNWDDTVRTLRNGDYDNTWPGAK